MDAGALFSNILSFLVRKIVVPSDFYGQAEAVKEMLRDDVTGLIDSLTDFAVDSATVDYTIETDNKTFSEILRTWLDTINVGYKGQIPTGVKPLAKEYFKERWKASSFPVLKIAQWTTIQGIRVPSKMFFVDGASIKAKDLDDSKFIKLINYEYYIGSVEEPGNKLGKNTIITKPYGRWFDKFPIPYLIKRGVYHNFKIIQSIKNKETEILNQIIPYMLLVKKGTEALALQDKKIYNDNELKAVLNDVKDLIKKTKDNPEGIPTRVTQFDEDIKHFIPDLSTIFEPKLFEQAERNILAGIGFIDVVEATSSSRRESILNPKPFIEETQAGVEGFKQILKELVLLIKEENKTHTKFLGINANFYITASPIKSFMTEKFKQELRLLWKHGQLSNQTYSEMVGQVDFRTEVSRREKEAKNGIDTIMYPHLTNNQEDKGIDIPGESPISKNTDKNGSPLPPDKTQPEQKEEFELSASVHGKTTIVNGHTHSFTVDEDGDGETNVEKEHFHEIENFEVLEAHNHIHKLLEERGIHHIKTKKKKLKKKKRKKDTKYSNLETAPFRNVQELPARVKNSISKDLQNIFMRVFNNAFQQLNNETRSFRIAWSVVKRIGRKNKKGIWIRKKKRVDGQLKPLQLSQEILTEVLEVEEQEAIDESIKIKKLTLLKKQTELADKLLGYKK